MEKEIVTIVLFCSGIIVSSIGYLTNRLIRKNEEIFNEKFSRLIDKIESNEETLIEKFVRLSDKIIDQEKKISRLVEITDKLRDKE